LNVASLPSLPVSSSSTATSLSIATLSVAKTQSCGYEPPRPNRCLCSTCGHSLSPPYRSKKSGFPDSSVLESSFDKSVIKSFGSTIPNTFTRRRIVLRTDSTDNSPCKFSSHSRMSRKHPGRHLLQPETGLMKTKSRIVDDTRSRFPSPSRMKCVYCHCAERRLYRSFGIKDLVGRYKVI
jgi:hypothetical protein